MAMKTLTWKPQIAEVKILDDESAAEADEVQRKKQQNADTDTSFERAVWPSE